jgi:hypothetical protein
LKKNIPSSFFDSFSLPSPAFDLPIPLFDLRLVDLGLVDLGLIDIGLIDLTVDVVTACPASFRWLVGV